MKHLILTATLLMASFNLQAYADVSEGKNFGAELTYFQINHDHLWGINEGSILISEPAGTITLSLNQDLGCKPNQPCITLMPNSYDVELEIISEEFDSCNAKKITAINDNTPVDGLYEEVVVYDYSTATCEYFIQNMTQVTYTTIAPRTQEMQESYLHGEPLRELPISF